MYCGIIIWAGTPASVPLSQTSIHVHCRHSYIWHWLRVCPVSSRTVLIRNPRPASKFLTETRPSVSDVSGCLSAYIQIRLAAWTWRQSINTTFLPARVSVIRVTSISIDDYRGIHRPHVMSDRIESSVHVKIVLIIAILQTSIRYGE